MRLLVPLPPSPENFLHAPKLVSPSLCSSKPPTSPRLTGVGHAQTLEGIHPLKIFRSVIPREAEGLPHTICRYLHIPCTKSHLHIPVASFRPEVPNDLPFYNVHPTHVTSGQRLPYLLEHNYPRPEILEHEMFLQPPRSLPALCATTGQPGTAHLI